MGRFSSLEGGVWELLLFFNFFKSQVLILRGFNGTERPGAVYLAATLAAHNQFGLPTFGIYGKGVQYLRDKIFRMI